MTGDDDYETALESGNIRGDATFLDACFEPWSVTEVQGQKNSWAQGGNFDYNRFAQGLRLVMRPFAKLDMNIWNVDEHEDQARFAFRSFTSVKVFGHGVGAFLQVIK